jgi:hypothetical protein
MAFSMAFRMACYCANTIMWMWRNGGKDGKNIKTLTTFPPSLPLGSFGWPPPKLSPSDREMGGFGGDP